MGRACGICARETHFSQKTEKWGTPASVILLHGLLGYSFSWRFTMPALAPYATVYAPDMMGAGFSDRAPGIDHSMRGTARAFCSLLANGWELLRLICWGLRGGAVAMMAAAECLSGNAGLHLRRLVLVAPVNPYSAHGRWLAPFAGSNLGAPLFRLRSGAHEFLVSLLARPPV
jgi:pimeloyl-ACP methyl ester carboxylesterase